MAYSLKEFHIHIPEELIAQYPSKVRGQSRLLVVNAKDGTLSDDQFGNIVYYISPRDCIIYNDAKVINARLAGMKEGTGARVEILLTRQLNENCWQCIIRPARRVRKSIRILIDEEYQLEVTEEIGEGIFEVCFSKPLGYEELKQIGEIPLPKYIKRHPAGIDDDRYQTVFSNRYGAIASPTAGLHFTREMVTQIEKKGAILVPVTLYVDWGTFKPVRETDYRKHRIHREIYEISEESASRINRCIDDKRRIVCVGTTSVRTIETAVNSSGKIKAGEGETDLFIYPGYFFKLVDAMITNFHLPDSTLLLLVAAFAGKSMIEKAYAHAVDKQYRFFSYGDAMLITN